MPSPKETNCHPLFQDQEFMEHLRWQMLKFATLQLNDAHKAEDAVQEALIGAFKNSGAFAGRSAFKTWVFAILKNKIADILRYSKRFVEASQLMHSDDEDEDFSLWFDDKGHWQKDEKPVRWHDPDASFEDQQFWLTFEACLENLPANQARIFMMREFVELETDEICDTTGISSSNLFVMLHRARLRLRNCLEDKWYAGEPESC
jgi:RNA polymerase sigma-70 factor (TIGR02943 family)